MCILLFSYLFDRIKRNENVVTFLDSFKTFPVLSPVFCFGAPAFWETSLKSLGIPAQTIKPFKCSFIFYRHSISNRTGFFRITTSPAANTT
jgi:hypothetical protein